MGKNKFYVIWRGKEVDLVTSHDEAERQTRRVFNGRFQSFDTRAEAVAVLKKELAKTCRKLSPEVENDGWPALWD
jgi:viroplasmin and RNaseH domain-containing protein